MSRRLPTKREIEKEAIRLSMMGSWKISSNLPEREELREEGLLKEAQHRLMSGPMQETNVQITDAEIKAQMHGYVMDMASELGLKVVTKSEYAKLQRIMQQPRNHKYVKTGRKPARLKREFAKTIRKTRQPKPKRVSLRKPLDIGSAIRGKPLAIPKIKAPPITAIVLGTPKRKVKRKKRKRNHSRRVGKTPRRLKKLVKNGKKSFSFPDHVWKVRKL